MDATNVFGDRFWACRIASISYRIYALKQSPDAEALGYTPGALRRAEVALRKESQSHGDGSATVRVSLSPSGRELWAYAWDAVPGPGSPDPEQAGAATEPSAAAVDLSFPALSAITDTTAQGVFLPPFTAASASISGDHLEARYGPLLRAIELTLLDSLLRNGDRGQYEAFGSSAALSTGDGSIVRFSPSLYQQGALVVRITQQRTLLVPPPVASLQFCSSLVWMLPHGRPGRLTSRNDGGTTGSAVEPANRRRARQLFALLNSQFVMNTTLHDLENSLWLRVSALADSQDLLWPVALIRSTPLTTSSSIASNTIAHSSGVARPPAANDASQNGLPPPVRLGAMQAHLSVHTTYPHRLPLAALARDSPYSALTAAMGSVRQELATAAAQNPHKPAAEWDDGEQRALNQPVLPPPPSPRLGNSHSSSRMPTVQPSPAPPLPPAISRNPSSSGLNALLPTSTVSSPLPPPVPALPGFPHAGHQHVYPTPTYHTPNYHTPNYAATPGVGTPSLPNNDTWMDVDNDDDEDAGAVHDADFNFFDLPVPGSARRPVAEIPEPLGEPLGEPGPSHSINGRPESQIKREAEHSDEAGDSDTAPAGGYDDPGEPPSAPPAPVETVTPRTKFAVLDLNTSGLDAKYQSGGRFFMAAPQAERDEDDAKNCDEDDEDMSDDNDDNDEEDLSSSDTSDYGASDYGESMWDQDENPTGGQVSTPGFGAVPENPDSRHQSPQHEQAPGAKLPDLEEAWLRIMSNEPSSNDLPIDNSKFMSFRNLVRQLVWDGGLLSEMYDAPYLDGEISVAPQYVIQRLGLSLTQLPISPDNKIFEGSLVPNSLSEGNLSAASASAKTESSATPPAGAMLKLTTPPQQQHQKLQLLSPPFVRIRRGDQGIKARISILNFWRMLNLAPPVTEGSDPSGDNTVTVVLVTLSAPAISQAAREFLSDFQSTYEECRLGKMELPTFGDVKEGLMLISADLGRTSGDAVGDLYQSATSVLKSQMLSTYRSTGPPKNLLFIVSYPPSSLRGGTLTAVVPFQIAQGIDTIQTEFPESQWLLSSLDLLVNRWDHAQVISAFSMQKVALLAYARFRDLPHAFQLVGLAPQSSGLQFTPDIPPVLMEDENFLHAAYLLVDGLWCLTSWTDQWARQVRVDVFRVKDLSERGLQTVFLEIWRRSQSLALKIRDRSGWRYGITRCGMMDKMELAVWKRVFPAETPVLVMDVPHPRGVRVADTRSVNSQRQDSSESPGPSATTEEGTKFNTPSSSPGGSSASSNASNRSVPWPADGVILNEADEVYGISIEPPQPGVGRFTASLSRGFLVRPDIEGHMTLETRLLHIKDLNVTPKVAMSRVIGQFRRLASLSEYSGVTTRCTLIPWHILGLTKLEAAALKLNMM